MTIPVVSIQVDGDVDIDYISIFEGPSGCSLVSTFRKSLGKASRIDSLIWESVDEDVVNTD